MQYEAGTEKAAMIGGTHVPAVRPMTLADQPQIQRTRKILLILLGICLALCTIRLCFVMIGLAVTNNEQSNWDKFTQVTESFIAVFFYAFGLFVAYKYHQMGLRVCGWIGVALSIPTVLRIGFLMFMAGNSINVMAGMDDPALKGILVMALVAIIIAIIIYIGALILLAIIVVLIFKLAKLIDANKHSITPSV